MLAFAEYCRWTLAPPRARSSTCREELVHVEAYLALERARFGDSLEVERARRAVRRARRRCRRSSSSRSSRTRSSTARADRPLRVVVRAEVRFGRLRVTVRDNGRGIPREIADRVTEPGVGIGAAGLGLASVAQRIAAFYGERGAAAGRLGAALRYAGVDRAADRSAGRAGRRSPRHEPARADRRRRGAGARRAALPARARRRRRGGGRGRLRARGARAGRAARLRRRLLRHLDARADRHRRRARARVVAEAPARRVRDRAPGLRRAGLLGRRLRLPAEAGLGGAPGADGRAAARRARGTPERAARGELAKVPVTRRGETLLLDPDEVYYAEPTATTRASRPTTSATSSTQSMRELEDSAALGDVLPHPPLASRQPAAGGARSSRPRRAAGSCASRTPRGRLLEVARRQTRALKQHLGLRA